MPRYAIKIRLVRLVPEEQDGEFTVEISETICEEPTGGPPVLVQEDTVEWSVAEDTEMQVRLFAVDFCPSNERQNRHRSPVAWPREQAPGDGLVEGQIVRDPAYEQRYRYAIAVWDGENLYALDPEIRVGPRRP